MTRSRRTWWVGGAVAAGAVAVATVVVLAGGSGGSGSPEAGSPPPVGAQPGQQAPEIALRTAGGDADEIVLGGGGTDLIVASFLAPG